MNVSFDVGLTSFQLNMEKFSCCALVLFFVVPGMLFK